MFVIEIFTGRHFFINDGMANLTEIIKTHLKSSNAKVSFFTKMVDFGIF